MMVIEDVDVVEAETTQTLVEAGEEIFARAEVAVGPGPHVPAGFGGDDQLVAAVAEVVVEDPGEIVLRRAEGGSLLFGQVEMGDAKVEGRAKGGTLGEKRPVVAEVLP